ncbi:hypothetical protein [Leekyejoonella antrihumi]|uniref:Uncharacterized protein n=1 Tax=Leekyejoonella antrihumi TaxID=1660198 RepID=A0A563E0B0_9MICO|nr:hypothetical protein [Leekyejoonella antrihumi]TWP35612.1 hypothetical protein FGL98_13630 [Leekyejoonella antrihumi]
MPYLSFESRSLRNWEVPRLDGLASLTIEAMPAFEALAFDGIAALVVGGSLEPPHTIEHGSRVASEVIAAVVRSPRYHLTQEPPITPAVRAARSALMTGAHDVAAGGVPALIRLVSRIVEASLDQFATHHESSRDQARSLFYAGLLATASGSRTTCSDLATAGVNEIFEGWEALFTVGLVPRFEQSTGLPRLSLTEASH